MDVGLGIAGLICVLLAVGHTTIGVVWVLPGLEKDRLPATPFGPRSMTLAMLRVTWFIVTIFALGSGFLLIALAWDADVAARTLLLRTFAVMWVVATAMALAVTGRPSRRMLRLPVPALWIVVAVLCWTAST
jgi:hypothetical protein